MPMGMIFREYRKRIAVYLYTAGYWNVRICASEFDSIVRNNKRFSSSEVLANKYLRTKGRFRFIREI